MNQTPARDLADSNLFPSSSCVSVESHYQTQSNSSKVKFPFSTVRLPPNDDFTKNKIMELQDELIKLRKQCSIKECVYTKQKSSLLNRIEILAEENNELKHRIQSLTQLNHTLQLAMRSQDQSVSQLSKKDEQEMQSLKEQLQAKTKMIKQLKRSLDEHKMHIRNLQDDRYRIIEEKDKKIGQLSISNKQLFNEKEEQQNRITNLLNSKYCNQQMVSAIYKALNIHINKDISLEDVNAEFNCFDESPITKRVSNLDRRPKTKSRALDTSYSCISSRSFINQLNTNNYLNSECSQQFEESQMLLCQICRKVYEHQQFINHMKECQALNELNMKKQQLEKAIHDIDQQQRKSISQKKWKTSKIQQRQPLKPFISNNKQKIIQQNPYSKQQYKDRGKKIVVQLHTPQEQGFRSNKFY